MKTITGNLNFTLQRYSFQDFLADMDRHNCEVVDIQKSFFSYTIKVKGTTSDLEHARWYFENCGSLL